MKSKHYASKDDFSEIQKLKSMVNHLEKKNNLIMKKLEVDTPEQKKMVSSSPNFFSPKDKEIYEFQRTLENSRMKMPITPGSGNAPKTFFPKSPGYPSDTKIDARREIENLSTQLSESKLVINQLQTENFKLKKDLEVYP